MVFKDTKFGAPNMIHLAATGFAIPLAMFSVCVIGNKSTCVMYIFPHVMDFIAGGYFHPDCHQLHKASQPSDHEPDSQVHFYILFIATFKSFMHL